MKSALSLFLLPTIALAFPGFQSAPEPQVEERQLLGSIIGIVDGLLGSVAAEVDLENLRPEPGFVFQEPGPNDSRGPCPGLNLLANYGYLPRNGYVSFGEVLEATARGFNMGTDLATVLCVFAVITNGDIATESWWLGSGPDHVGGLNRHSTVEVDISVNREDFWMGCGDNHHLSSRLFTQNVKYVAAGASKQFDFAAMAAHYGESARFSQQNNPYLYYFPFPSIVSVVAFNFYPAFFGNGTYGLGGVANYESISSIVGAQLDKTTGNFKYVAERWPAYWYRRAYPYTAEQALIDGFSFIYPADPVAMPIGQLGTPNFNVTNVLCDVYLGINSVTPLFLGGDETAIEEAISWALGKFADAGLDGTALGCPQTDISPNALYPNATLAGGPINEPAAQFSWTGNNVYNKTYFCSAPESPTCSHTC